MNKNKLKTNPVLTIFAGVNGSGKSTFYYLHKNEDFGIRLNSDELIQTKNQDWSILRMQMNAAKIILTKQEECLEKGISFNRELTFCGKKSLEILLKAKQCGFTINLFFFGLNDVELCKKRVKQRVLAGGHGVSEKDIEERYSLFINNLVKIYKYFNNVKIYDNSGKDFKLLATINNNYLCKTDFSCEWGDKVIKLIEQQIKKTKQEELTQ